MSVINQMLRDLDARAASDQERAGLPPRMRTLPPGVQLRRQNLRMLAIGIGIGAVLMASMLLLFRATSEPPGIPLVAPSPVPAVPTAVPAAPTSAAPAPSAAPALSVSPANVAEMKLSMLVGQPQTQTQPKAPASQVSVAAAHTPSPVPPAPIAAPVERPDVPAPVVAPKPVPAPLPAMAEEAKIDKQPKVIQGRDLAETEYRKAMQAVKRGDNEAALPLFKRALELDPELARARQGYLSVLVATKRLEVARQVAEQGLALDPTQSGWANIVARLQFDQGDTAGAVKTLERFVVHAQHDADYQGLFAYLLQKQQRPDEAAERFRAALQVRPNEGRWWFGLGLSLEQVGNAVGAKEAYAKAKSVGNLPSDMVLAVEQKLK